jgi:hypothetical protein
LKLGLNLWRLICVIGLVVFFLCTLNTVMAEDQNPPDGKDEGVWVLTDKKPDVEAEKDWDNGAYYNNHVSLSGTTVKGGYSWKDGDDPDDCKGTVWGTVSWNELSGVIEPGERYETTLTAEAGGSQSCSSRHPGACAHLEINDMSIDPHPCISYNSGEPKPPADIESVSWEAPWGNIGDNLTIAVITKVSGSTKANVYYIYSYKAEAPEVLPNPSKMWPDEKTEEPRPKAKTSKDLKLHKILQIYQQSIPHGLTSSGNKNNLLSWFPGGDKYDEFKCGGYQSRVLKLLDSLKFSDNPEERSLLDEWDYGPIEAYYGGHQAVVIYPKGTDWVDNGIVLDPWIEQSPKAYDIHGWAMYFSEGTFHGIRGSSVYEGTPEYPTVGGNYIDPRNKKRSPKEMNFLKNLPVEKRTIYERLTEDQKGAWIKAKMAEQSRGGRAMGYSPLNIYLVDNTGRISGFPDGVPTLEIPDIAVRRLPLSDGTYWTEIEYPLNVSYSMVIEGTGEGVADVFLGFGLDDIIQRSIYKYNMQVSKGQRFEALTDSKGSPLSSGSGSIYPEVIQEVEQVWLDSRPEIVAPPQFKFDIEGVSRGTSSGTADMVISSGESYVLLDNWNKASVENNPSCSPSFTINEPYMITYIDTYHWNYGQGTANGETIGLIRDDGTGWRDEWDVQAEPGMNGVPNAWWKCYPMIKIPAGTYIVFDSNPVTWSQNSESDGCGFAKVKGYPVGSLCFWNGTWETNFGQLELQQVGDFVHGTYTHDQGKIEATVSGDKLIGTWSEAPSYGAPSDAGDFEFIMSEDCKSFSGTWRYGSAGSWEDWTGTRK